MCERRVGRRHRLRRCSRPLRVNSDLALLNPGTVTQIIGQALIAAGLMDDHRRVVATIHIAEFARGTGNGGDNLREQPLLHFPATGMLVLTRWRTRQCYPLPRKQTEQRNDQMQDDDEHRLAQVEAVRTACEWNRNGPACAVRSGMACHSRERNGGDFFCCPRGDSEGH